MVTPAKAWLTFCVALVASLTLFVFAGVGGFARPIAMLLVIAGIATIVCAFVWKHRADRVAAVARRERESARVEQLKRQIEATGDPVNVKGSGAVMLLVLVGVLAIGCLYAAIVDPSVGVFAAAIFIAMLAGLVALVVWPLMRKPAMRIRADGIETPAYGFLPWSAIDGMGLREARERGAPPTHFLDLHVVDLGERAQQMHVMVRWIRRLVPSARRAQSVQVRLAGISETPAVVHELCRSVWTARTGLDTVWSASMSELEFQALRASSREPGDQSASPNEFESRLQAARVRGLTEPNPEKARRTKRLITSIVCAIVIVVMMAGAWLTGRR